MKIAFVVGSLSGGGAERVVSELASMLAEKKNEVYVLLIASIKNTYHLSDKVSVIDCSQKYNYRGIGFVKRVSNIRNKIKRINPDVTVSFTVAVNLYTILSCMGLKTQLVLAERNDPRFDPVDKKSRIMRNILYPFADYYVFQTEGEKDYFSNSIQNKSTVIYNPVNPDMPSVYKGHRRKVFVTAARLESQKNIKMAIDAFKKVNEVYPDYCFEIYGNGSLRDELKKYIEYQELSEKVHLMGSSNTIYEDIKDCFAFLLSSNYEGMSNSMLEAMALGLPVISTDYPSGGAREIIKDGVNGFLVPVGDSASMAEKMKVLIDDCELQKSMSDEACKVKHLLNIDKISESWISYFEGIIKNAKK